MPNWFENHPAPSIITYTLVIIGATWGASTFILQDNRLNLARSELESQKSLTEQYKSKTELLQRDIEALRLENAEYRAWLGQTKDAIPVIIPRITELKEKVASLESEATKLRSANPVPRKLTREYSSKLGIAFIDDETGLVFAVKKTTPDRMAVVIINFPDRDAPLEATISPGQQWRFKFKEKEYLLTVTDVSFYGDSVGFRVTPSNN